MTGLLKKEFYLIIKNLNISILIGLIPPLFVGILNINYFLIILTMTIPMLFVSMCFSAFMLDEAVKWRYYITTLPIKRKTEVGSKYILLIILCLMSALLLILTTYLLNLIYSYKFTLLYAFAGFTYSLLYGLICIPVSYKFGTANSKYFFMLFITIPIAVILVLDKFNIKLDLSLFLNLNNIIKIIIFIIFTVLLVYASFAVSVNILNNKKEIY